MGKIVIDLFCSNWGDLLSAAGLAIGIWTLVAARGARDAASEAAKRVRRLDAIAELAAAIALLDEARQHHVGKHWHLLPDRYSRVRQMLVAVRHSGVVRERRHLAKLSAAVAQVKSIGDAVAQAVLEEREPVAKYALTTLGDQIDELSALLTILQTSSEEAHDEQ